MSFSDYEASNAVGRAELCLLGMIQVYSREPIWSQITSALKDMPALKTHCLNAEIEADFDVFPRKYGVDCKALLSEESKWPVIGSIARMGSARKMALRKSIFDVCMDVISIGRSRLWV